MHRDFKPANVMVDGQGRVKLLDFGLARALEAEPGSPAQLEASHSPTLTNRGTVAGVLLGTAAYMSPEQAAGKPADRRADVWAFVVVLFEMLSARRMFEGETVSHVLAGVLKDEPTWGLLPAGLPPRLRRLLERCLRKDPRHRLQSFGDARVVLEEIAGGAGEAEELPVATPAPTETAPRWQPWAVAALALAALVGFVLWGAMAPESEGVVESSLSIEISLPTGMELSLDHQEDVLAISVDGRRQAFVVRGEEGGRRLAVRDLGHMEARILPGTEGASCPGFSPDGTGFLTLTLVGDREVDRLGLVLGWDREVARILSRR